MNNLAKIDTDAALYVLHVGPCSKGGYSHLGFDVLERDGARIMLWLQREAPREVTEGLQGYDQSLLAQWQTTQPGTAERYAVYSATCAAGHAFSRSTGKRCDANLSSQLVGLEGHRVDVVDMHCGPSRRFIVGKSTGWLPVHLEIARRNSSGGGAASRSYASVRDLGKVR